LGSTPIPIQQLRASHHQLAELLSQGRPDTEVALITGYSLSRISILKRDPTFQELLANYATMRQKVFVDTLERMRILGLSSLDELQERLETAPERWSNRELMEMAELMLVKPTNKGPMGPGGPSVNAGVQVNVQFVESHTPPLVIEGKAGLPPAGSVGPNRS
jgi:hypothetical protein